MYSADHRTDASRPMTYYTLQRRPRLLPMRQQQSGARAGYVGSECFLSLVDTGSRHLTGEIRQLDAEALCTNRDLPIQLAAGSGHHGLSRRRRCAGGVDSLHRRAELSAAVAGVWRYGVASDQSSVAQLPVARRCGHGDGRRHAARHARAVCRPERCGCRAPDRRCAHRELSARDPAHAAHGPGQLRTRSGDHRDAG